VAITLQAADLGDTTTVHSTLKEAQANAELVNERGVEEAVLDKGYHSGQVLVDLNQAGVRTYVPEPERGKRDWDGKLLEKKRVEANRRRTQSERGKALQKLRSEHVERSFAHMYETGGMRRVHLRGRKNILKRLLFHAVAFNVALLVRKVHGIGKPRTLQGVSSSISMLIALLRLLYRPSKPTTSLFIAIGPQHPKYRHISSYSQRPVPDSQNTTSGLLEKVRMDALWHALAYNVAQWTRLSWKEQFAK
jgi:transposase